MSRPSTDIVVYLPDRGVGDLMWHLPTVRAIAQRAESGAVILAARPSSRARELLRDDPAIARVCYLDCRTGLLRHPRETLDAWRLLRRLRPREFWTLEKIGRPVMAAALAGVPRRFGFGLGHASQERWLSPGPRLSQTLRPWHRIDKLRAFEQLHGLAVDSREPALRAPADAGAAILRRYGHLRRPWVVLGIGASTPERLWPMESFEALAQLLAPGVGSLFWFGGPGERPQGGVSTGVEVFGGGMDEGAALFAAADLFIGNDSGPLNVAAAVGCPAIGLFGPTPPLRYSRWLLPLVSPDGSMASLTPASVAAATGLQPSTTRVAASTL